MQEVKSYSEMRRDFYKKYQKKIVPSVKMFDKERKTKRILATIVSMIFLLVGLACLLGMFFVNGDRDMRYRLLEGAVLFFSFAWLEWTTIKKKFESKIKAKIMPIVCSCFENLTWSEGKYDGEVVFKASGVVPDFTSGSYDDIFTGSHRDVNIEIVESEYVRGSGKNSKKVFNGVVVKLNMNKAFTSHTLITPDKFFHNSPLPHLRHTTLEDVQFEKNFDVFTNDEVDARYLITTSFMARLKAMKIAFRASQVQCAFYGNFLLVALSTSKDLFSIGSLVKPIDDHRQYFQMYEEIISIVKLIDHFKLNQKIGL